MKWPRAFALVLMIGLLSTHGWAQQNSDDGSIHVWPVHGSVYLLVGAGSNITLWVGKDGVLMGDSGLAQMSEKVTAPFKDFPPHRDPKGPALPVRYIINTSVDADHPGGNKKIPESSLFKP